MAEGARDLSVLIAEHDGKIRKQFYKILRQEGMAAEAVGSGQECLERLSNNPFQIILADVDLPDITPAQLIDGIRARATGTQIVMIARADREPTAVRAVHEGAFDYLIAPLTDVDVLTVKMHRVGERFRLESENRRLVAELTVKNTDLTRQNAELYALAQWGQRLSRSLDLGALHQTVVEGLSALVGARPAALFATPKKGLRYRLMAVHPPMHQPENPELPLAHDALPTTKPEFTEAIRTSSAVREALLDHLGSQTAAVFPLSVGEEPYGFLAVLESENPGPMVTEDGLTQYVSHISVCIANAVLFGRLAEGTLKDKLTSLYGARYMSDRLVEEVSRSQRNGLPLSLLTMDVNVGADPVLIGLADILKGSSHSHAVMIRNRLSDIPCRIDEMRFALILPDTDKAGARIKADNIRAAVEGAPLPGRQSAPGGKITVDCGIATYPEDGGDADSLQKASVRALETAARQGGIVAVGDPEIEIEVPEMGAPS